MTDNTVYVEVEGRTYQCILFRNPIVGWAVQTVVDTKDGSLSVERIKPLEPDDYEAVYAFPLYNGGKNNRVTILPGQGAVHVYADVAFPDGELERQEILDLGIETPEARTDIPDALRRAIFGKKLERERKIVREIEQAERAAKKAKQG